jgi:hypothetical protein
MANRCGRRARESGRRTGSARDRRRRAPDRTRPLRMDMQMRLTGVARVPHGAEPDPCGDGVAPADLHAARSSSGRAVHRLRAAQQDVVARHVLAVHLGNPHVGQTIHREHDPPGARGQHAGAVDGDRHAGPAGCRPLRAQPEAIQLHEVDAIRLPAPLAESGTRASSVFRWALVWKPLPPLTTR